MFIKKIQDSLKSTPEFTTFPRTFESYSWYKPIAIAIIGAIIFFILMTIMFALVTFIPGVGGTQELMSTIRGGYDTLNPYGVAGFLSILTLVIVIPSLYLASKIVRDRPFSSYSSSRNGWNWSIFFKSLGVSLGFIVVINILGFLYDGASFNNHFTIITFILCTLLVPLQCIAEEYLLRGYVMQTIGSWFGIPILAIIIQALLFAAVHPYNLIGVVNTLVGGLCFGIITYYTKGIEMSSGIHAANNLIAFYISGFGLGDITSTIGLLSFVLSFVGFVGSSVLLLYVADKRDWFKDIAVKK